MKKSRKIKKNQEKSRKIKKIFKDKKITIILQH